MNAPKIKDELFTLQNKVFTRWVNEKLKCIDDTQIKDISNDLLNGLILAQLAQALTKNDSITFIKNKTSQQKEMINNYKDAIDIFLRDGVKFDEITIKDINENSSKISQKIIWDLISHYSINKSLSFNSENKDNNEIQQKTDKIDGNSKENLLSWANKRISNYPHINNFHPYELFICALLDSYVPDKINYYGLDPNNFEHNMKLALEVMKCLGIPIYIYEEDISMKDYEIDEKALLTQLSSLKIVLDIQESMTQSFSISSSKDEIKNLQNSENSSNTFVEFDYDSFSQSESLEKFPSNQQPIQHDPSLITLSNSESIYRSLTTALSETQRVSQKEIEKLMARIESLSQQLYESRGKISELTKNEKINQTTINDLKQKLIDCEDKSKYFSEDKNENQSKIDDLSSQVYHLKKELTDSENLTKELSLRLSETEKNDQITLENLKHKLYDTEKQLSESITKSSDSESRIKELSTKLVETETAKQDKIDKLEAKLLDKESQLNTLSTRLTEIERNNQEVNDDLKRKQLNTDNHNKDLQVKLDESEKQSKELSFKLTKTMKNDQEIIENLKQKQLESENQNKDLQMRLNDLEKQSKELSFRLSETVKKDKETIDNLKQKLEETLEKNKSLIDQLASEKNENELSNQNLIDQCNAQSEIARLTKEIDRLNNELNRSLSNADSLAQKLEETESNYEFATKQFSEVQVSMRKSLLDSETKSQILATKTHQEIEKLNSENALLKEELQTIKSNEMNLTNQLIETKKKAESEINSLMIFLSDSEKRYAEYYDKKQSEIESLTKQLQESRQQTQWAQSDFEQMKQAFADSQARIYELYGKLYNAQ